jgi:hypothetical protein
MMTRNRCTLHLFPPRSRHFEVPHTKQHLQEGERRRNGAAARTEPVLGFPSVCRVQCTGDSHNALQEGMVSPEGDTASGLDNLTGISPAPGAQKTLTQRSSTT